MGTRRRQQHRSGTLIGDGYGCDDRDSTGKRPPCGRAEQRMAVPVQRRSVGSATRRLNKLAKPHRNTSLLRNAYVICRCHVEEGRSLQTARVLRAHARGNPYGLAPLLQLSTLHAHPGAIPSLLQGKEVTDVVSVLITTAPQSELVAALDVVLNHDCSESSPQLH